MNKKLVILGGLIGLLLPSLVFGAVSYSRTPSGYNPYNPISFFVSFNSIDEICSGVPTPITEWRIMVVNWTGDIFFSDLYPVDQTITTWITNLPLGIYKRVASSCHYNGSWYNQVYNFEFALGDPIFEVVPPPPPPPPPTGNYVLFPTDYLASLKATTGEFFSDLAIPLVLVICLPIAFWILDKAISLVKSGLSKKT